MFSKRRGPSLGEVRDQIYGFLNAIKAFLSDAEWLFYHVVVVVVVVCVCRPRVLKYKVACSAGENFAN